MSGGILFSLLFDNMKRWRWRLLTIAFVVALSACISVLFGSYSESEVVSTGTTMPRLELPYFDVMVQLKTGQRPLEQDEMPPTRYQRSIYGHAEAAHSTTSSSVMGLQEMLGLTDDSAFFAIDAKDLQGRHPQNMAELLVPQNLAVEYDVHVGDSLAFVFPWEREGIATDMSIVGIYAEQGFYAPLICRLDDFVAIISMQTPNRYLINYDREAALQDKDELQGLRSLQEWLAVAYPQAVQLSSLTPERLQSTIQRQSFDDQGNMLTFVLLFMAIAVFTITLMTFLERRGEWATLKTIGIDKGQITMLMLAELLCATLLGWGIGCFASWILSAQLNWTSQFSPDFFLGQVLTVGWQSFAIVGICAAFPLATVRVASVAQLLYDRTIPLRRSRTNVLERATPDLVYRERLDNVRVLQLPIDGDVLHFKKVGDEVKEGEIVAQRLSLSGYALQEWAAFCTGMVIEFNEGGLMVIRPDAEDAPFFAYPQQLVESGRKFHERFSELESRATEARPIAQLDPVTLTAEPTPHMAQVTTDVPDDISRSASASTTPSVHVPSSPVTPSSGQGTPPPHRPKWLEWFFATRKRAVLSSTLLLLLALALATVFHNMRQNEVEYITQVMERTTLRDVVKATGMLEPIQQAEISSRTAGYVEDIAFQPGDHVQAGQLLYRLANPSTEASLKQAEYDMQVARQRLATLMGNNNAYTSWTSAQLKVQQIERNLAALAENEARMTILAPASGQISDVLVRDGATVSAGTALFSLYSTDKEDAAGYAMRVQAAEALLEQRAMEVQRLRLTAETDGIVMELPVEIGQVVHSGTLLLSLHNEAWASQSAEQALRFQQSELNLQKRAQDVENLNVTAPHTGKISNLNVLPGDEVAVGALLAEITDNRQVQVRVDVPQSYINGVRVGNKAEVSIANSAREYQGFVTEVKEQGQLNTSNYLVTYPVNITIDNDGTLLAGMSATVTISSSDATISAVRSLRGTIMNDSVQRVLAKVSGTVVELHAQNGDWVLEGQTMAVLHNEAIGLAYAEASQALQALGRTDIKATAQSRIESIAVGVGEGVVAGQELLRLDSTAAEAAYAAAKLEVERLYARQQGNETITAPQAGKITLQAFQAGDTVEAGDVLATVESDELQWQKQRLQTELELAEAELEALRTSSAAANDSALAQLSVENAERIVALREIENANLQIRALIEGVAYPRQDLVLGQYVRADMALADIYNTEQYVLRVAVDEGEVARLKLDLPVEVEMDALPEETLSSVVSAVAFRGTTTGGITTYAVGISLEGDERLKPGMTGNGTIIVAEQEFTLAVPKSAVREVYDTAMQRDYSLVRRMEAGKIVDVVVETGIKTESMIEITKGLRAGDEVIIGEKRDPNMPGMLIIAGGTSTR